MGGIRRRTRAAAAARRPQPARHGGQTALPLAKARGVIQPSSVASDYAAITAAYRRLYANVEPTQLHPPVIEHTRLGTQLLGETAGVSHSILATALAETLLLAGRIEFFDLRQPDDADATFVRALQAAGEADDALLGSAILAHAAFIPGWVGRRDEAADRMRAARTYARRGPASAEFLAWLDAVEAECETISGHTREALRLIEHAETPWPQAASTPHRTGSPGSRRSGWPRSKATPSSRPGTCPQAKETLLAVLDDHRPGETSSAPSSSATWPPSKPPSTTPKPPAPTPTRPSTSSAHLVRHRHGPGARSPQDPPAARRAGLRAAPR